MQVEFSIVISSVQSTAQSPHGCDKMSSCAMATLARNRCDACVATTILLEPEIAD